MATLIGLACLALAFWAVGYSFFAGFSWGRVVITALALGLSFGLLRISPWALTLVRAVAMLLIIGIPFAMFNPFSVGDYLASGRTPPTVLGSLPWLLPLEVGLFLIAYVLGWRASPSDGAD